MPIKRLLKQKVAKRILVWFFIFSFLITAISIGVVLYSHYKNEKNEIVNESNALINSRVEFISEVLWNIDKPLAELSIKSLAENPDITYIAVYDENKEIFTNAGNEKIIFSNSIEIPLRHLNQDNATTSEIGTIIANISTASAAQHVKNNFINIVLVQTIKSAITSLIFLILIYNIMIKHLNKITQGIVINSNNTFDSGELIKLERQDRDDELQLLADTLNHNKLSRNKHLKVLDEENSKLILEIASRKAAEKKASHAHEELRFVLDSFPSSVYFCTSNGEVKFMNYKAKKHLSHSDSISNASNHKQQINQIIRFNESDHITSTSIDLVEHVKSYQSISNFDAYLVSNDEPELFTLVELTVIPTKQNSTFQDPDFILIVKDKSRELRLEEMSYMASHDFLTKSHNKMYLDEKIELRLAEGTGNYSLAIIDLDNFKTINDTGGHLVGDELLKEVAKIIPKSLGINDVLARIGGGKFVILFNLNQEDSVQKSFKIIADLESLNFSYNDQIFPISCSIGITDLREDDKNVESVMLRADRACYQVKSNGKGSVLTYKTSEIVYMQEA